MTTLLDKIKLPETLRELSAKQLEQLSAEIRQKLIETTSQTGGHLAPSLGAVDLAVSLHAIFESPKDKLLWDVGHQAYAHKILTGRLDRFSTLRQRGGLSGFPNADESPHDSFTVGHASTSISQALGLVKARDLNGEKHAVVAVIGDGSISGGLAFEGMNNVDGLKSNLIVVLNDNEMSISKNVGAIASYLTQVSTSDAYVDLRNRIEHLVKRIPKVGVSMFAAAKKLKDRTKHIVVSFKVDVMFEELGFKYFGPIDGHNIPLIMSTLHHAREIEGPVLIHVITKKGKGYPPAEKDPTLFHGIGPFDIKTGQPLAKKNGATYTEIFGQTMVKLGGSNKKVVGVTAAMIDGTGLDEFAQKFPERFFDVGIAEEHAVTFAGALAKQGFIPIVAVYSTFLQRAYDEIMHDVALQKQKVIFAVDRAGIVGEDGVTHNGIFDIAYLRTVPGMTILAPSDGQELNEMLTWAVEKGNGPIAIRYPRGSAQASIKEPDSKNAKIAILATGSMINPAREAALKLGNAKVISCPFVKPLDKKLMVESVRSVESVITVEEGIVDGGFGSAVLELLSTEGIKVPVVRLGLPDEFIEHGTRAEMLEAYGLTADGIYRSIKERS
jgi:1-deoxy-D-xylulose-5-phosphate synthase